MNNETYIGDAVYASFDGFHVKLRTGDGNSQVIYLDPEVFENLVEFEKYARAEARALMNAGGGKVP